MKRIGEGERQTRGHGVFRHVLTAALPAAAAVIAILFVLLCRAYGGVHRRITVELGEQSPEAAAFLRREGGEAAYVDAPEPVYAKPGEHRLQITVNGRTVPVVLCVRDTTPPKAEAIETTVAVNERLSPDRLIRTVRDSSIVKVTYEIAPAFGTVGDYEAVVLLEDESGNQTRLRVPVHVRAAVDTLEREAGAPVPEQTDFLVGTYADVRMDAVTDAMMHTPGTYPVRITADDTEAESLLIVKDTVPPQASGKTVILTPGDTVLPEMLVDGVTDETDVTAAFASEPDPDSLAPQTVVVLLNDLGGNETRVESTLLFSNVRPTEIEARTTPLTAAELLEDGSFSEASFDMTFVPRTPGMHVLAVTIDGERNLALIDVKDTTPPAIVPVSEKRYLNRPLEADALVRVSDATETKTVFAAEPDWSLETQDVTVVATDACGNTEKLTFELKLTKDTKAPKLYGVRNRVVYTGEAVAYLDGVYAEDVCDGAVKVSVDASAVDTAKPGKYRVLYTATDLAGNTARETAVYTVVVPKYSEEEANAIAQKVLEKILTDGMTLPEQVEAIYNYVFRNVRYNWLSNKQDWRSEAVRGLTEGRGDCFTCYAAARLLLEQTDAEFVSVQRSKPNTRHYWLLVNVGTGWYHFDPCNYWTGKKRCFMWTDSQTRRVSESYWRYDKTLYPQVAKEPYNGGN